MANPFRGGIPLGRRRRLPFSVLRRPRDWTGPFLARGPGGRALVVDEPVGPLVRLGAVYFGHSVVVE